MVVLQDATGPNPPIPIDLAARIRAVLPTLSPAQASIVRIVASDPAAVAALSVNLLAARAETSTATVVRAARSLGFGGYPQLRLALAAHTGSVSGEATVPLGADIVDGDSVAVALAKLASFEAEQVRATAELVDPVELEKVIALVSTARHITVHGIGASGLVATDLAQKLGRIGLTCHAHTEYDAAMVSASLLGPLDVAIGVSHSGENPGAVEPLALARSLGAATVAITGAQRSTLARIADHVLATAGREFGFRSAAMASRTGQLLIVDGIFIGVAQSLPSARSALQRTHDALAHRAKRSMRADVKDPHA
ncbi:MurR/RpiR family transcriptional regulator [Cryobacterium sp. TMT2-15-1]|uniref:MurR/RpiR family transcriptional regulator n=1 Tax=Cryobacterium sp. TMT2-15-1 TaxID=1259246 RepID=UPI001069BACB|nr:MurR/RpiR family transcriptional regulator [Cryobacterium sp. TMT2-15-1]TFC62412.1 MurR/RpiR family transcriptional regulator [Cryobacterium sp. TMT2-15-1]